MLSPDERRRFMELSHGLLGRKMAKAEFDEFITLANKLYKEIPEEDRR